MDANTWFKASLPALALVLVACGSKPESAAATPAAPSEPTADTSDALAPFGPQHRIEAIAVAAKLANRELPGALDLKNPTATYSALIARPSTGAAPSTSPPSAMRCWVVTFRAKTKESAEDTAAPPQMHVGGATPVGATLTVPADAPPAFQARSYDPRFNAGMPPGASAPGGTPAGGPPPSASPPGVAMPPPGAAMPPGATGPSAPRASMGQGPGTPAMPSPGMAITGQPGGSVTPIDAPTRVNELIISVSPGGKASIIARH